MYVLSKQIGFKNATSYIRKKIKNTCILYMKKVPFCLLNFTFTFYNVISYI